jgi:hypothetical protein
MSDLLTGSLEVALAAFATSLALKRYFAKPPHSGKLPPGPPSLPILGNALSVDVTAPWLTYKAWGDQYGKLSYRMQVTISN